jgi:endonuclease I
MSKRLVIVWAVVCVFGAKAQIPPGYYSPANGLSGAALQNALHNIIKNHTVVPYTSLYAVYDSSDLKANGQVWDMYSDVPGGTPPYVYYNVAGDRCGSYTQEGDCFNREHSWPQSWFNSVSPPVSDAFHIFPTDGWVNNQRSNYPYGEVSNPGWTSLNGSRLGNNITVGYSGTVFEPIDAYKGDIARGFFYMATRYLGEDAGWASSPATSGATILPWELCVLITWHHQDTVSAKELNRNDAIYKWQNNRNPFIDHPEWVDSIFACTLTSLNDLEPGGTSLYPNPCSAEVTIELRDWNQAYFTVYNSWGQAVRSAAAAGTLTRIGTAGLPGGIYVVQLKKGDSVSYRRLVVD